LEVGAEKLCFFFFYWVWIDYIDITGVIVRISNQIYENHLARWLTRDSASTEVNFHPSSLLMHVEPNRRFDNFLLSG
jgi:hypothetical protein